MYSMIVSHPYSLKCDFDKSCLSDFLKENNLWYSKHPLTEVYRNISNIPNSDDKPLISCFNLASNMLYDFYNNGGGNNSQWTISKKIDRLLNKAITAKHINSDIKYSIKKRLSNIFEYTGKGRNFSRPNNELYCRYKLEQFYVDIVYYCGLVYCPDSSVYQKAKLQKKIDVF